ncbi:PP2C family serine/threonine-protein phosphatase [Gulosibacter sp. 10]|uniref:PP2C family protein-serine/threonine phosphatase n=1 Tax=Gulosibacter sp. 10 TaxID=1255570 RepID=UPI00097F5F6F|nr:PP2C family serine/threonine-protein phosphatase [Gulosibacter sp. 10]SJM63038.1 Protein serine/threonine phosphatase PrpC, regulation of stationary phase [Gulosibacter sp. 10]
MTKVVRAGAVSHVGRVRANNQDSGFIGKHVYGVADGMGGHAGGDVASSIAVKYLAEQDRQFDTVEEAERGLTDALHEANELITDAVDEHSELRGMGTTADLITRVGDQMVIAHIGDSRVYRFHDGQLEQVTVDHTFVQRLVDAGRITPEEALVHPRRSVLMRVLGDVETEPDVDTYVYPALDGDRWLLCSDGLASYVDESKIATVLGRSVESSREVADDLVQLALDNGAPDNVTVVVLELGARTLEPMRSRIVGAAANPLRYASRAPRRPKRLLPDVLQSSRRLAQLPEREEYVPPSDEFLQQLVDEERKRKQFRRLTWAGGALVLLAVIAGAVLLAYNWTQGQYYVGEYEGHVAIFQGVHASLGSIDLSSLVEQTDIRLENLPAYQHMQVNSTIAFGSIEEAQALVERLEDAADSRS